MQNNYMCKTPLHNIEINYVIFCFENDIFQISNSAKMALVEGLTTDYK
jgi:hypothetical protein